MPIEPNLLEFYLDYCSQFMRKIPIKFEENLYLATRFVASNPDWLNLREIKVVFTFGESRLDTRIPGVIYFFKKWDKERPNNMLFMMDNWIDWIEICLKNRCRVMVNCDQDYGIGAAVIMAYTMRKYEWTRMRAFRYVYHECPVARCSVDFHQQLDLYEAMGYKIDETNEQYRSWIEQGLVDPASSRINLEQEMQERERFADRLKTIRDRTD